ncbi:unnamed protein product [Lactuca virosa]|uniref:Cation/H+ exchanger transmembrane domain-containing protein n=1 Tax=Lactuca virosa TaxID=75947 RepID=A0AAU9PSF9_9ASTR|nr:unnamed protein product [Lactuca virosa]
MDVHLIKKCMAQMVILAGPGVLMSTFLIGLALKLLFPYNWSWKISLLLGGLLSATDPVAVLATLKELGATKKLSTIIEGESIMNDGMGMVVYTLFFRMVTGSSFSWGSVIMFLATASLGAVGMGIAFGLVSYLWLGFVFKDPVIEITMTLSVSYLAYFMSQEVADISGVLTVMAFGMFFAAVARTAFDSETHEILRNLWEMVAYIANTLIFILCGAIIAEGILTGDNILKHEENYWGYLILLYVVVQLSRGIVVGLFYPFLSYFGYGLDWKEAIVLMWSGLRGPVALSLALSVKQSSDTSAYINQETGTLFVVFTGGIVFLTLIVNGSTTQFVLQMLKMDKMSAAKRRILDYTKYEIMRKSLEAFSDLMDDEELGSVDWHSVKNYITCLNDEKEGECENDNIVDHMDLSESDIQIRIRFLNGVQDAYCVMLKEGEKLESACYISAAFLRAHKIARQQLHDFIGDSENGLALKVINESETEGEEAKKFLEDVRITFPQVLGVLKTRQMTYSVLNHLNEYVEDLDKSGLLEKADLAHLHDSIQSDLKKLVRNPCLFKIPKAYEHANPSFGSPSIHIA